MFTNDEMLKFIADEQSKNGYAPTQRQIAEHYGVSVVAIHKRLKRQCKAGKIEILRQSAHGLSINGNIPLTPSQVGIKKMIESGLNQSAIALALGVSPASVCEHVRIVKTVELGFMVVSDLEDLGFHDLADEERASHAR
jgi:DNA-binding CsgD family transcriptional regulator